MSDAIKHECGIAHIRLLKPLEYYKEKYGTAFYGVNKMYLLMEKQHNRGQDGAGLASIKLDTSPGKRYISRVRSSKPQPIQDIFSQINKNIYLFDLRGYASSLLERLGFTNIWCSDLDTYSQKKDFFSYRLSKHNSLNDYGRMISVIKK